MYFINTFPFFRPFPSFRLAPEKKAKWNYEEISIDLNFLEFNFLHTLHIGDQPMVPLSSSWIFSGWGVRVNHGFKLKSQ